MDINNLKLIIWDLDDTFWEGTLSEGPVEVINENVSLVRDLTNRGIINTICSKNYLQPVLDKLEEIGIKEYFVFISVDWTPKGSRISATLKDMGLRATNALFIDDNVVNLNEATHFEPTLNIATPTEIKNIIEQIKHTEISDKFHKRLRQYRILEEKRNSRNDFCDNESFLYASGTVVCIHENCLENIDRIHELILRTNQLNYTKKRISKEELDKLLNDSTIKSGFVTVKDNFGDYGIVGFYALNGNELIHFLFSCRTIGQGVEQWVYSELGFPHLEVCGKVIIRLNNSERPGWINQTIDKQKITPPQERESCLRQPVWHTAAQKGKIIFKGPCDISAVTAYLSAPNLITEFNYFSDKKNNIAHQGNITNILQIPRLTPEQKRWLSEDLIFNDGKMYRTSIFDKDVKLIFLSSLTEFHYGIYRHKKSGIKLAFADWFNPITDEEKWTAYVENNTKQVWTYDNKFTYEFLREFANQWEFLGRKSYEEYLEELKEFMGMISPNAHVCIMLGSEVPFEKATTRVWKDRHLEYRIINRMVEKYAKAEPRVHTLNYTDFIRTPDDYTDCINHYQRHIYYKVAEKCTEMIS